MTTHNPIGDAGQTLLRLLRDGMGGLELSDQQIELVSPAQFTPDGVGLSLHLYHVAENAEFANDKRSPGIDSESDGGLMLELYYLLTAHPPDGNTATTSETMDQHQLLSEAIRILGGRGIVTDPDLHGSLAGSPPIQVSISRQSPEQLLDVWNAFPETQYLPSVSYVVTPVPIATDQAAPAERVVDSRIEQYLRPDGSSIGTER